MAATWKEQLQDALIKENGQKKGLVLSKKYSESFPQSYFDDFSVQQAISDINHIENLSDKKRLAIHLYFEPHGKENILHLRLFQWQKPIALSDILPMLENLNLRTDSERPYEITVSNHQIFYIDDFSVIYTKCILDLDQIRDLFQESFSHI